MSTNAKDIRKQIRNVLQENLGDLLTKEVVDAITKQMNERITALEKDVKEQMHKMNERHKEVMGYLVRQVSKPEEK